jgi:hypothetical protein
VTQSFKLGLMSFYYLAHGGMLGGVERGQVLESSVVRRLMLVATSLKQVRMQVLAGPAGILTSHT